MKTIILLALALFAAGCLEPASKINGVAIGMTKDQVISVMGSPASITADTNAVYLNYALEENPPKLGVPAVATPYAIRLVNGKVDSYGRAGAPNAPNAMPVPIILPSAH
jgi:hypothetical protein